jgi:serine/threonine protein kinase
MDYLNYDLKILHRDLKAENIFLNRENDKIIVKIGDFGCALLNESQKDSVFFRIGTTNHLVCFYCFNIQSLKFKSYLKK